MGHARALITIADKVEQLDLYHQILENELSVRAIEDLSKGKKVKLKPLSKNSKESGSSEATLSFEQQKTLQDLREYFSTEVQLKVAANGKGKIEIPFGSEQDLKIILSMLSID
jgi:ParB family chromosome partitioning protein